MALVKIKFYLRDDRTIDVEDSMHPTEIKNTVLKLNKLLTLKNSIIHITTSKGQSVSIVSSELAAIKTEYPNDKIIEVEQPRKQLTDERKEDKPTPTPNKIENKTAIKQKKTITKQKEDTSNKITEQQKETAEETKQENATEGEIEVVEEQVDTHELDGMISELLSPTEIK